LIDVGRPGDLHVEVRLVDQRVQTLRLGKRSCAVVREGRVDLHRHVPAQAVAAVPDAAHQVARVADVAARERDEDLLRVLLVLGEIAELAVVGRALRDCLLEDGRVRGDTGDGVLLHHPRELAVMHEIAGEKVNPHALAERGQLVQA
jgi:hypothetical protein